MLLEAESQAYGLEFVIVFVFRKFEGSSEMNFDCLLGCNIGVFQKYIVEFGVQREREKREDHIPLSTSAEGLASTSELVASKKQLR